MSRLWIPWKYLGILVTLVVGGVVYYPSLAIGFWTDDYRLIDFVGRLDPSTYLWIIFNPLTQILPYYRPLQEVIWWIMYWVFGGDAWWFHVMQVGLHLVNVSLLFALVARFANWRWALVTTLVYLTISAYNLAVFWVVVADPLTSFFYLLAIQVWIGYLGKPNAMTLWLTFILFLCSVLSKEIGITLPVILFLMDRWLVGKPLGLAQGIRRYGLFVAGIVIYGLARAVVLLPYLANSEPDYESKIDVFAAAVTHLKTLAFPWGWNSPISEIWVIIVLGCGLLALIRRHWRMVFIYVIAILTMLPVTLQPLDIALPPRYLYLPLMGTAIGTALVTARVLAHLRRTFLHQGAMPILSLGLVLLMLSGSYTIAESAENFAGLTRQVRLQFQPIFRQNPSFAPGTLLYFIDPPLEPAWLSGLVFLRYGADVHFSATGGMELSRRQDFGSAFVFYRDDQESWHRQAWEVNASLNPAIELPATFGQSLALDTIYLSSNAVKQGEALVILIQWRALQLMDRDYTVFAHILNQDGKRVAGSDSLLQRRARTTRYWRPGQQLASGIVVPIDADLAPGTHTVQLGLYDALTMQRAWVDDVSGAPGDDKIVAGSLRITK